jgi:hypothetical protein
MSLIPSTVTWPSLTNWQVSFQGTSSSAVVFGPAPFYIQSKGMEGFDLPASRTGDTNRPRARGEFIGLDEFSGRDLVLTVDIGGSVYGSYANLEAALAAVRAATNTADLGNVEYPMFVQFPNAPLLGTMVRVRKRAFTPTMAMALGNLAQDYAIQFHATDPFFYSQTQVSTVGLSTPLGGFGFPLSFNLSFGGGTALGTLTLTNYGDVECYPVLTITGPCTYPAITNLTISGLPVIQFGVTMVTGDTLVIDTDLKTAVYTPSGSSSSYSVMSTLQQGWAWWSMAPGTSQIQFTSLDSSYVAGTLVVQWASAYSSAL